MTARYFGLLFVLALPALVGCENSCQQMCREFADIFDECGYQYGDSELRDCVEANRIVDKTRLELVCDYGMDYNHDRDRDHEMTNLRADLTFFSDDKDVCETLENWCRTASTCDL